MGYKSPRMTIRPSFPTVLLLVQLFDLYGNAHAPVQFANFEKFSWWTLLITNITGSKIPLIL